MTFAGGTLQNRIDKCLAMFDKTVGKASDKEGPQHKVMDHYHGSVLVFGAHVRNILKIKIDTSRDAGFYIGVTNLLVITGRTGAYVMHIERNVTE